jgi:hypothetical protein
MLYYTEAEIDDHISFSCKHELVVDMSRDTARDPMALVGVKQYYHPRYHQVVSSQILPLGHWAKVSIHQSPGNSKEASLNDHIEDSQLKPPHDTLHEQHYECHCK